MKYPRFSDTLSAVTLWLFLVAIIPAFASMLYAADTDIAQLRIKAEKGDARAQFSLGNMYREGEGVPKDATEAVKWYRKSAEQGVAVA